MQDIKIIKSDVLNEQYSLIKTDCGLTIACYPMPKHNGIHAVFATNFGSINRQFSVDGEEYTVPAGIAHFLEHKMFENEDGDAFEKFAKTGANANAFTSFDKTCYIFSATDKINESLDILLSFVTQPYFTKETVAKEQGIIGQEIKMYDDSASWRVLFGILEGLYHNHSVKEDIAGSVESIAEITPEMLYKCAEAFYSPSEMLLSVAGNITQQQLVDAVERAGFSTEKHQVVRKKIEEPDEIVYTEKSIKMPISIPLVAIGFKEKVGDTITAKQEIIGDIIIDILTGSTSDLFNKLYDANVVNGTFEGEVFSGSDYYSTIISGETNDPQQLISEVQAAIDKIKAEGITEEQFNISKNAMYGSMVVDFENVEEVATSMVNQYFKGNTLYNSLETFKEITLEDVNNQLKDMFRDDKRTVFTVYPVEG
ncbi:MAG: insulinase family protein [Oscillospiraceae bacterium]|nr:insulinase family protein [Oscillospiraceae bacterium]